MFLINILPHGQRIMFCCTSKRSCCQCGCSGRHTFQTVWVPRPERLKESPRGPRPPDRAAHRRTSRPPPPLPSQASCDPPAHDLPRPILPLSPTSVPISPLAKDVLCWSCTALAAGAWPSTRHDGVPWASSPFPEDRTRGKEDVRLPRAAVLEIRGDWAHFKQVLGLCGWSGEGCTRRVCWVCLANKTNLPYTDPSLHAPWRGTRLSHIDTLQEIQRDGTPLCALWSIPGMSAQYLQIDLMHAGDLGVLSYLTANVLWEVFKELGGSVRHSVRACSELHALMRNASKRLGQEQPPVGHLVLSMFWRTGKCPKFRGKALVSARDRRDRLLCHLKRARCSYPSRRGHLPPPPASTTHPVRADAPSALPCPEPSQSPARPEASETRRLLPVLLQILEWMPRDNEHKEVRYLCVLQAAANVAARQPGFSVEEGWAAAGKRQGQEGPEESGSACCRERWRYGPGQWGEHGGTGALEPAGVECVPRALHLVPRLRGSGRRGCQKASLALRRPRPRVPRRTPGGPLLAILPQDARVATRHRGAEALREPHGLLVLCRRVHDRCGGTACGLVPPADYGPHRNDKVQAGAACGRGSVSRDIRRRGGHCKRPRPSPGRSSHRSDLPQARLPTRPQSADTVFPAARSPATAFPPARPGAAGRPSACAPLPLRLAPRPLQASAGSRRLSPLVALHAHRGLRGRVGSGRVEASRAGSGGLGSDWAVSGDRVGARRSASRRLGSVGSPRLGWGRVKSGRLGSGRARRVTEIHAIYLYL